MAANAATKSLTSILERFGVNYDNAPDPSPAMLAFMRGLGMNMDTAEDSARTAKLRSRERTVQAREDISRSDKRQMERLGQMQIARGTLSSGETNKKVGRQAEETASRIGRVEQAGAESIDAIENALGQTSSAYRTQALDRTLNLETQNETRKASSEAQELSYERQKEAAELAYERQKAAQDTAYKKQEDLYKKYSGL